MIGGNTEALLKKNSGTTKNDLGERIPEWETVQTLTGWLDLTDGDSKYTYNAKLQESTHVFLCDYTEIDRSAGDKRMVANGMTFDVLLIDDPMELHHQLEIYLRYVG
jgi:hypothetical protein